MLSNLRASLPCSTFPLVSGVWDCWQLILLVKTKAKKALSTSAYSVSFVTRSPAPFSSRPTFSLVTLLLFTYLQNPFLSSFTLLTRFNSRSALAFLTLSLQDQILLLSNLPLLPLLVSLLYTPGFNYKLLARPCRPLLDNLSSIPSTLTYVWTFASPSGPHLDLLVGYSFIFSSHIV